MLFHWILSNYHEKTAEKRETVTPKKDQPSNLTYIHPH